MPIQYRYALDEYDALVDVLTLERGGSQQLFRCVACSQKLTAKLGEIKTKHFAHAALGSNCAYEGYLHRLAKIAFQSEYARCLERSEPFNLVRKEPATCDHFESKHGYTCSRLEERTHDLTKVFDRVSVEKGHGGFVADVLLESSRNAEVLFVEFAVTHRCEEEKIKSGARIIEYAIEDESDVAELRARRFADSDARVTFHNLRVRSERRSLCNGQCPASLSVFVVYESGKSILLELDPRRDVSSQLRGRVRHYAILGKSTGQKLEQIATYKRQAREAHFKDVPIRNCFVCRYHGGDGVENAVFCKANKRSVGSNDAVECEKYRPFRSMSECVAQDKKNAAYVRKQELERIVNFILPRPL